MGIIILGGLPANVVIQGQGSDPPGVGDISTINRTGIVANIASTKITNAAKAGVYFVQGCMECTASGSGTISFNVTSTDDVGSITQVFGTLPMSIQTQRLNSSLYLASGDITFTTTGYVSGTYAIRARWIYGG